MILKALQKSVKWILESQKQDGGFPFPEKGDNSACWLTSEALAALCRCRINLEDPSYQRGLTWLLQKQNEDGGWPPLSSGPSTTESTAWGLISLVLSQANPEKINGALRCLISLQDSSGGWPRSKGNSPTATMTSIAIMALEEAIGTTDPYYSVLHKGYQWMKNAQLEDGGWPTLNSQGSDIAPASLLLFASHKTRNELGQSLIKSALSWINYSGVSYYEWLQGKKWCSYETFDEHLVEWPRRKYFSLPFAIAGAYCYGMSIPNTEKLLRYLLDCQEESGRWILPSETGEEMYTWYTYVTAFALGSIPSNKQSELSKSLRSSILTESTKDRIFAIVIGINQYNDEQVKPLKCAENDEEAICKWLQMVPPKRLKLYRLSTRIPNNIPTRSAILGAIGKVSRQIEDHSQSILIFFFSGHGKRFGLKDYLLPSDFTFDAPEDTALALDDIISKIRTIKPYRSVLFIDACRDETSKGLGLQLQKLFTAYNLPSQGCITTILSCSGGENSFELPEGDYFGFKGLGAFTLALLKSVSGLPTQSKVISLKMILDRLPKELEQLNRKYGKDIQRPQINVENTIMLENTFLPMLDTNL